jgi:hypothetical protein
VSTRQGGAWKTMAADPPSVIFDAVRPEIADLRQVYINVGGSERILRMMCTSILKVTSTPLRQALEAHDLDLLGDLAHKQAGTLSYICAHSTVDALQAVNSYCRSLVRENTRDAAVILELERLVDAACEHVDGLVAAMRAAPTDDSTGTGA